MHYFSCILGDQNCSLVGFRVLSSIESRVCGSPQWMHSAKIWESIVLMSLNSFFPQLMHFGSASLISSLIHSPLQTPLPLLVVSYVSACMHYSIFSVPIHRWGVVLSDSLNISLVIQPFAVLYPKPYRLSETFVHVPLLKRECHLHGSICRVTFKTF